MVDDFFVTHTMAAATQKLRAGAETEKGRIYPLLSRRQVEGMIADGRFVIIVDQHVLKVDGFIAYHPGGDKAMMHMVGRDATDEVNAFVSLCWRNLVSTPNGSLTLVLQSSLARGPRSDEEVSSWEDRGSLG